MFSTMNTAPSTRMPKSTAPMESRLAEAFCRSRQMNANSSASGMRDRDDQAGAKIVEEEDQHHDHQQHAAQQVAAPRSCVVSAIRSLRS